MNDKIMNFSDLHKRLQNETGAAAMVAELIEATLEQMGYRLVLVRVIGQDEKCVLQIMAEKPDGTLLIEDCEQITKEISPLMDEHHPIEGDYYLEISSPGIDRPLVRISDFIKWAGFEVKIELKIPIEGQKRFKGKIIDVEKDYIIIEQKQKDTKNNQKIKITINFVDIKAAKLVMNDELMSASIH